MKQARSVGGITSTIYRYSQKYVNEKLSYLNIGSGQYLYILELRKNGDGINQEELTEHLNIDKAITTRVMKKLEVQGIVNRVQDENDKRAKIIYLTDKGYDVSDEIVKVVKLWNDVMLKGFTEEEKGTLILFQLRMLDNVLENDGRKGE